MSVWFPRLSDVMRQHIHHYRAQGLCFSAKCNPLIEGRVKVQVTNVHKDKNLKEKKKSLLVFIPQGDLPTETFQSNVQSLSPKSLPVFRISVIPFVTHHVCALRKEEASAPSRCTHSTWVPSYVCAGQLNFRSVFLILRELSRKQTNKQTSK